MRLTETVETLKNSNYMGDMIIYAKPLMGYVYKGSLKYMPDCLLGCEVNCMYVDVEGALCAVVKEKE